MNIPTVSAITAVVLNTNAFNNQRGESPRRMKDCMVDSDVEKLVAIAKIVGYEIEEDDIKVLDILGVDTK